MAASHGHELFPIDKYLADGRGGAILNDTAGDDRRTGRSTMRALSKFNTRYPFHPYPTGWFVVAFTEDLAPGDVKPAQYFGQDLVLFRTEAGKAVVADAHCPHLGAHLGYDAKVEGASIICPFHGWGFGSDGACTKVPFTKLIPPRARIRVWPVMERSGLILAWHDLDGREPFFRIPDVDESKAMPNTGFYRLHDDFGAAHPQDMFENAVDFGHFPGVHSTGRAMSNGPIRIDGHRFMSPIKILPKGHEDPDEVDAPPPMSFIDAEVQGGGLVRIESHSPMLPGLTTVTYVSGIPVDENLTHYRVRTMLLVADDCKLPREAIVEIDAKMVEVTKLEQYSDGKIWPHKRYVARPMLSNVDGPFLKYREWYAQYHPRVDAAFEMAEAAE
jgi:nitrite reductase/ring-hydroxylating ferredoxin subunit